jgi:hypothetical protein
MRGGLLRSFGVHVRCAGGALIGLMALFSPVAAAEPAQWVYSADFSLSYGNRTYVWPNVRGSIHYWGDSPHGLGISFGALRWYAGGAPVADIYSSDSPFDLGDLEQPGLLYHASFSWLIGRPDADALGSTTFMRAELGGYMQRVETYFLGPDGLMAPGGSIAFGWMGTKGLAPSAAVRWDIVLTDPGPTFYIGGELGMNLFR